MSKTIKIMSFVICSTLFLAACGAEASISVMAVNAIERELKMDIEPAVCKYNEEKGLAYVKFAMKGDTEDQAILKLNEKNQIEEILYQHIYDTIAKEDHEQLIAYGDYALYMNDIATGDDRWSDMELTQ